MHRFYVRPDQCASDVFELGNAESHHATHVLRVRPGEAVTVLSGEGGELLCEVVQTTNRRVTVRVLQRRQTPAPLCRITLYQAIPKGKTFDNIIHKATELGVSRIVPIVSEHVIARPDEDGGARKAEKWRATALEAIKQCGQPWLPEIDEPRTFADVLQSHRSSELELIGALYPGSKHPRAAFQEFETTHQRKPATIAAWIGPEGDFTREEVAAVTSRGAVPITLGPLVLKCDTAATYTLSVINYEVQSH